MKNATIAVVLILGLVILFFPSKAVAGDAAALFKSKCAMCHGADGTGNTPMGKKFQLKDLGSAEVQKMSDEELHTIIAKGKDKMPAYEGKISDEDIKGLVAFIRGLAKK